MNLIPLNEIIKDKGLKVNTTSDLLTENETAAADHLMECIGEFLLPNKEDLKSPAHAVAFQESIRTYQKNVRIIKNGLNTIVSERITACFAPYQGAARNKAKKEKITTLIANAKNDPETRHFFNPSMVLLLAGKPRQLVTIPENWNKDQFREFFSKFENILSQYFDEDISTNVSSEYFYFLGA